MGHQTKVTLLEDVQRQKKPAGIINEHMGTANISMLRNLGYGVMRDSVAVNQSAVSLLTSGFMPLAVDINCFSHTISHVGEHLAIPDAVALVHILTSMFGSDNARQV